MLNHGYFQAAGQAFGPCTPTQLQRLAAEGTIKPSTLVRRGEDGEWVEAGKVKGLFPTETAETPKPQSPVAAETEIPKVELQPPTVHQAAVNATPSLFRLIKAALLLPFIPIGFWGQTKRWKLFWAEDPKTISGHISKSIYVAERIAPALHALEPSRIEYCQLPRKRHAKIYHVIVTIQTANGASSRIIEMPNRWTPGPSSVVHACFYPGLHNHHMAEAGYVNNGSREKECVLEKFCCMTFPEISKILPLIDRMAKAQADRDIAHYNHITDFRDDLSGLRDIFGNPKTNVCFVGSDFIDYERELDACPPGTPLPSSPRSRRKRDADKKRAEEANRKTG